MIAMYSIVIGNWYQSNMLSQLISGIQEMQVSNIDNVRDIGNQLNNDVYEYIRNYAIDASKFVPTGGTQGTMLMSDRIVLTIDSEIAQGATLKIEYKMPVRPRAYYGTGGIGYLEIIDYKHPDLGFSPDEKLLTDSSKKNSDYGWHMNDKGQVVTNKKMNEARLVLSVILSSNQLEEAVYTNSASCKISFDAGNGSNANYNRSSTAMEVQVLPPFGEDKQNKFIILGILCATTAMTICIILIKRKNNL